MFVFSRIKYSSGFLAVLFYENLMFNLNIFYVNSKDPRIIVPKINPSMGWTINFGHKITYIGIVLIVLILVAYQVLISI